MKPPIIVSLILGALMTLSAGAAKFITPTEFLAESLPPLVLESAIPVQFAGWVEERNLVAAVVNPQAQAMISQIYAQTLSRTYLNKQGERIMLSIAYGKDQGDAVQVHYPEVCYPAQGFQLKSNRIGTLSTAQGSIPIKRLETVLGAQRYEPVTYWTTVGSEAITGGIGKKLAEMRYGLRGQIPDGLLFRVSSIDADSPAAFALQETFIQDLMTNLSPNLLARIAGLGSKTSEN